MVEGEVGKSDLRSITGRSGLINRMRGSTAAFRHKRRYAMMPIAMELRTILLKLLPILRQTKNYARIVGVILFLIGLLGFAFRSDNSLPDLYLGGALVLGFWGIVSGLWDSGAAANEIINGKDESIEK